MCEHHGEPTDIQPEAEPPGRSSSGRRLSRRGLLAGAGAGLGLALVGAPRLAQAASTLSMNGAWCDPARGSFPNGGHFGAPRGNAKHAGQDISNPVGTALYAAAAGTVIRRGVGVLPGRTGNGIVIDHGGGTYTYYGHLNSFSVSQGAKVVAGRPIGTMGATGNVTGPHLHFETHTGGLGAVVDPVPFMSARGVDLRGGWCRLNPGASGQRVRAVQSLMNQRGAGLVVDGAYGKVSSDAVKAFQKSKGLVADGQVGPLTWPVLVYTLRQGAKGDHVKGLQAVLNKRGAGLVVDGEFGGVSTTAVRTFQGANRLVVDGEAGPLTWQALVA
ncbi:peptidoglycan DD-metalloendopeptidase family protein [Streptomyces sp. XM4193]|uniref:peptidoglycan DD-metalloendopeptidase family protein n=1 Tax=Streptomyces sp. XM4193 TaxID=2929782 RepID=UPI001FFA3441|nr:peptidoglycan DD-metalloendopeptidase family protein [Streptomyces sp. XM4193]MCK1794804.1 peptidoglycan DD-metalloendopeptidase family protein [Streptomyces sp. XM4193]